jgi:hypothetical protein
MNEENVPRRKNIFAGHFHHSPEILIPLGSPIIVNTVPPTP